MAPSHQATVTWLLAPNGGCVDWYAGRELGGHDPWRGGEEPHGGISVTACDEGGITWESSGDEAHYIGTGSGYGAPDVYVFFKRGKQEIGGFLDHWNGGTRKRSFENIEELWECRGARTFDLKKLIRQAQMVQIGLQGNKGTLLSEWAHM